MGTPANRTRGLVIAGDDGTLRPARHGPTSSPRAFGHNGAGGQIAWADPDTGAVVLLPHERASTSTRSGSGDAAPHSRTARARAFVSRSPRALVAAVRARRRRRGSGRGGAGQRTVTSPRLRSTRSRSATRRRRATSAIDVFSSGWEPGRSVAIALAGNELDRVRADAGGLVRTEVRIPPDVRRVRGADGDRRERVRRPATVGHGPVGRGRPRAPVVVPASVGRDQPRAGARHGAAARQPAGQRLCGFDSRASIARVTTDRPSGPPRCGFELRPSITVRRRSSCRASALRLDRICAWVEERTRLAG